jgi:hypothetical protein
MKTIQCTQMIDPSRDALLLACLKARWDPRQLDLARRIANQSDVNWGDFLDQATKHAVAPLIYHTLREDTAILRPPITDTLREAYYASATKNALLHHALEQTISTLHESGIPVILLKGSALAYGAYGNIALRPMGDVDLLVRTDMMPRTQAVLAQRGYLVREPVYPLPRHVTFTRTDGGVPVNVEIHQHIVSSPYYRKSIPEEWLWQEPLELSLGSEVGRMLSPEAAIFHSCLHFLDHTSMEGGLLWLWDIVEIARNLPVHWETVADRSAEFGITLPVRSVLLKCRELLGLVLPDDSLHRILSSQPGFVERQAYQFCLSPSRSSATKTLFDFLTTPGLRLRFRFLSSRVLPSRHHMMARYSIRHPALVPFYYARMVLEAVVAGLKALLLSRRS